MIIGITGGSGSGKTTLLDMIRQLGGLVLDCDAIYHRLLASDPDLTAAIEARFPGTVVRGALQRKKLGQIVFSDEGALKDLNRITHGAVKQEILRLLETAPELVAIDAIGLFEGELASLCQVTVAVTAPLQDRIARLMARDGISEEYARQRIAAQHDDGWFRQRCGYRLDNSGTPEDFRRNCVAFFREIGIIRTDTAGADSSG